MLILRPICYIRTIWLTLVKDREGVYLSREEEEEKKLMPPIESNRMMVDFPRKESPYVKSSEGHAVLRQNIGCRFKKQKDGRLKCKVCRRYNIL